MAARLKKTQGVSKSPSGNEPKILDTSTMQHIVKENINSVSLIDKNGTVLFVFLGVKVGNLVGRNVRELNQQGMYEMSTSEKAFATGKTVTDLVKSRFGTNQIVTSTPLKDENGNITMVLNTALDKILVDKLNQAIKEGETVTGRFKAIQDYLSDNDGPYEVPVAESPQMKQIVNNINAIARTDSNIMLTGESGSGKEIMARCIHHNSLRANCPFIPVNCASIPETLLESEFFGYVRGAFTGANPQGKPGLFEIAHNGTLFLDEIAELPLSMQPKLLRVLETGEIKRVGGTDFIKTNVRIISATNKDLKEMIREKLFRSDLYYRLNVLPVNIPPLRERTEDIEAMANKFLYRMNKQYNFEKTLTPQTLQILKNYSWPGNARELRNVIERLVITSKDNDLYLDENFLGGENTDLTTGVCLPQEDKIYQGSLKSFLKKMEGEYIKQVLDECNGKVGEAAKRLGIHRTMLYRKIKELQ